MIGTGAEPLPNAKGCPNSWNSV